MDQRRALVTLTVMLLGPVLLTETALGQSGNDVVGTYTLVSVSNVQGGNKTEPYGSNPKGVMRLENNGRYVVVITRPDLPTFASNDRNAATLEEYKAISLGSFF